MLLNLVITLGVLTVAVCGVFLLQDWSRLRAAYLTFEHLSSSGAEIRQLFVAEAAQNVHRVNCFAEGVGVLLGAILAAIGIHGRCLLERPPG